MVRTSPSPFWDSDSGRSSRRRTERGRADGRRGCRRPARPSLAEDIEAGELQRGENLRAVVVERRGGVGDQEAHLFEARRVVADQIGLHGAEDGFGRFAAAAHFAQPDQAVIGFDFDDGADEAAPAMVRTKRPQHSTARRASASSPRLPILPRTRMRRCSVPVRCVRRVVGSSRDACQRRVQALLPRRRAAHQGRSRSR